MTKHYNLTLMPNKFVHRTGYVRAIAGDDKLKIRLEPDSSV